VLANYRPISNLPFMSKILEKVVADQLCDFLHDNNLFEEFQSGFNSIQFNSILFIKPNITNHNLPHRALQHMTSLCPYDPHSG